MKQYRKNYNVFQNQLELDSNFKGYTPYRTGMFANNSNYKNRQATEGPNYEVIPGVIIGMYYRQKLK